MSVVHHLRELPGLAAATTDQPSRKGVSAESTGAYSHPTFGPRLPPGLDLDAIDRDLDRQGSPDQLAKLSQCVRVVLEERDDAWHNMPGPGDCPTWHTEVRWLLATHGWWSTDQWCSEWITTEVTAIRAVLIERVERRNGWTRCAMCGGAIGTYSTELLDVAECKRCERVVSMRERDSVTLAEAATVLGISVEAAQKRVERGQLRKVGRRGKQTLVALDRLDKARAMLGLTGS